MFEARPKTARRILMNDEQGESFREYFFILYSPISARFSEMIVSANDNFRSV